MIIDQEQIERATNTLLLALYARHADTADHCGRVYELSLQLGRELQLTSEELESLKFGALLHDIGKLSTPDAVLTKPGPLDDREWEAIKRHPADGAAILRSLHFPGNIVAIVERHHERPDGFGYPFGLKSDEIPITARVVAVTDTYDAITSDRCYRRGECHEVALHEIASCSDKQFDPCVVAAFIELGRPNRLIALAA